MHIEILPTHRFGAREESSTTHQGLVPWVTGWMVIFSKGMENTLEEAGL